MTTNVTLLDAATGIGAIANISQFVTFGEEGETNIEVKAKDGYVVHQVGPLEAIFGVNKSTTIDKAVADFGIEPQRVFFEVVKVPQELIDQAAAEGGLNDDDIDGRQEEIWVAAFGPHNSEADEGVALRDVTFVRVA